MAGTSEQILRSVHRLSVLGEHKELVHGLDGGDRRLLRLVPDGCVFPSVHLTWGSFGRLGPSAYEFYSGGNTDGCGEPRQEWSRVRRDCCAKICTTPVSQRK